MKRIPAWLIILALLFIMVEACTWTLYFVWPLIVELAHVALKMAIVLIGIGALVGLNVTLWPHIRDAVNKL